MVVNSSIVSERNVTYNTFLSLDKKSRALEFLMMVKGITIGTNTREHALIVAHPAKGISTRIARNNRNIFTRRHICHCQIFL